MKNTAIIAYATLIAAVLNLATITTTIASYDYYLLSCGASDTVANKPSTWDGRTWYSDHNSTFSTDFSSTIAASTIATNDEPYSTARIFTSNFTYTFPVSPGPKFIRLFFNPSTSPYTQSSPAFSRSIADAYLTVLSSSGHLLLSNFSAYLNSNNSDYILKEYYVNVLGSRFQLTFFPTMPNSFAFVNGIEVVSIPGDLYNRHISPKNVDDPEIEFVLSPTYAFETAYRLNVGGMAISSEGDSGRMYRHWVIDDRYVIDHYGITGYPSDTGINYTADTPSYSAPELVYQTFRSMGLFSNNIKKTVNVTWEFGVDLGFYYLLRLHWCEVVKDVNSTDYRVFNVYIDHRLVEEGVDVYGMAGGQYKPIYRDYVVLMGDPDGTGSRGVLQLAMHTNTDSKYMYYDILLNGLEIFKINTTNGILNALNPSGVKPSTDHTPSPPTSSSHIRPAIIGAILGAVLLSILLCCLFIIRQRKLSKKPADSYGTGSSKSKQFLRSGKSDTTKRSGGGSSTLPSHLCHYFSLEEIRLATSDFSDSLIIGHGGFGNVYKGTVNTGSGPTTVAIKRLNPLSNQGAREFAMEIQLLSKLRHLHLVSLIGYCDAAGEMILIYEYMSHGTLRDHLFPHNIRPNAHLPWPRRLQICVGAARGLHYLHTGTERMVIHRDVKSTNILLDERWVAKVSDFGLSKLGPTGDDLVSHVSTVVKGSFGYVDPEYYRRQQLTEKSDVYSFGVVLFEVLCGRAAVNPNLPKEQVNLRIWARRNQLSGTLDAIVDPMIMDQISPECLRKFGDVAESCVRDEGVHRPSMADVIAGLELAIQIQSVAFVPKSVDHVLSRTTTTTNTADDQVNDDLDFPITSANSPTTDTSVRLIKSAGESTWTRMNNSSMLFSNTASEPYGESTDVFSQIFKADGR